MARRKNKFDVNKSLDKAYRTKHKGKIQRLRSYCKNFILNKADASDITDIQDRMKKRSKIIKQYRGEH